jgi:hypothetical protein
VINALSYLGQEKLSGLKSLFVLWLQAVHLRLTVTKPVLTILYFTLQALVVFYSKDWRKFGILLGHFAENLFNLFCELHHFRALIKIIYNVEKVLSAKGVSIFTAKKFY